MNFYPVQFPAFAGLSLRRQGDMPTSWDCKLERLVALRPQDRSWVAFSSYRQAVALRPAFSGGLPLNAYERHIWLFLLFDLSLFGLFFFVITSWLRKFPPLCTCFTVYGLRFTVYGLRFTVYGLNCF